MDHKPTVGVYVCTFRRNELLRRLLRSLAASAAQVGDAASVGVVVVDDNRDGAARPVLDEFEGTFARASTTGTPAPATSPEPATSASRRRWSSGSGW